MGKISSKSYSFNWRLHLLPVVVWLAVVACVVGLFSYRSQQFEVLGIAQGQVWQVAATCTGRLRSVPVGLFDEVKQGQTLVVVDTILDNQILKGELQAKLGTISAEIEHLSAQLVPTQERILGNNSDRQTTRITNLRRFSAEVENARLEILRLRAQIASDLITLENLVMEVKITEDLLKNEAVAPYELEKVKVQYRTLAKKTEENERLLEQAGNNLQQALKRQDEYVRYQPQYASVDAAMEVIRKATKVQERLMDEVSAQIEALKLRESLELKAPFDGVVSQVWHRQGETVLAGQSILTIVAVKPTDVVAYVSERQAGRLQEKMAVELVKSNEPKQIAISQVTYLSPTIEQMPTQLWRNPNVPQWGRAFLVKVPPNLKVIPGEVMGVRGL
jgi:multidrug resistance efflux pump